MKLKFWICCLVFLLGYQKSHAQKIMHVQVDGVINNVTADYMQHSIRKADQQKMNVLIFQLNTPGGLLESTRKIVGSIMDAPLPIVVYVGPQGARAGSAGTFITLAAPIAAMNQGTNIGAAHPIVIQGEADSILSQKILNDAAAFIKTIAENRNRNVEWAVDAVKNSVSISAQEALDKNVIDYLATDFNDLLRQMNGRKMNIKGKDFVLNTQNATIETIQMSFIEKFLNALNDPDVVYILFFIGMLGIILELFNPGAILPGVVGGISMILALYGMSMLPINYAGLALLILAFILFVLEIKITSHGILGIGGVISLVIGSMMLINVNLTYEGVKISPAVIISCISMVVILFIIIAYYGLKAQKNKQESGREGMLGLIGVALSPLNPEGTLQVHGEIWKARSADNELINKDHKVKIIGMEGLTLIVKEETKA